MNEELCFVDVVRRISCCAYGADWWLLVGALLATGIALVRCGLRAKRVQKSPRLGAAARRLQSDAGTVVLALGGGLIAATLLALGTGACGGAGVFAAGAVDGLLALGIFVVARAFGTGGSGAPHEPSALAPPVAPGEAPPGLWCPPAPSPKTRYQAESRRRCR